MRKNITDDIIVLSIGGIIYTSVEYIWRGYSHYTMTIVGSLCFYCLYKIYNFFDNISLPNAFIIGSLTITAIEFLAGLIINVNLNMDIWDYSNLKFNFMGQVCILYSVLWGFISLIARPISQKLKLLLSRF